MGEVIDEWKWSNWYQNEVDEEINGVGSRDKVKHNESSDQLFLERMMSVAFGKARETTNGERAQRGR